MTDAPFLISFGHGYSARALAARLLPQGWRILGTTRSAERAAAIAATGAEALVWPGPAPSPGPGPSPNPGPAPSPGPSPNPDPMPGLLGRASHLLVSAAPDAAGDPVLARLGDAIAAQAGRLAWVGYLSTTGVYGDHQGGWVDETSALTPATVRGQWRVAAEAAWLKLHRDHGLPVHIFRLAGIYGPGRGPFAKVRGGTARRIVKPGQVFSRIHVADIARVLEASIRAPEPGGIYNVCDNEAAPPEDVIAHAARLLGLPLPPEEPFAAAEMTPMARSFYAESKRVRNDRMRRVLGVEPLYPSYREGLAALMHDPDPES